MHPSTALVTLALPLAILARGPVFEKSHQIVRRAPAPASSAHASSSAVVAATRTKAAVAASSALVPASTGPKSAVTALPTTGIAAIKSGIPTFATSPLFTTFAPGATPTAFKGAPPLPDYNTIIAANYPALDLVPPIDSAQMKKWISEIDMSKVPNIPPTQPGGCANASNAAAVAAAGENCWWTCGHCTRDTDITFCPAKGTWGLSYDDGPSPSTPKLLDFLDSESLLATFFVVGSRAISRPQMLQTTYMKGHQISVHTWAHSTLTTLTNEQVIAELAWSKAIIKAVTGVTPNTMRPPYGDIDDRVRYISQQLGLTPIIWTVAGAVSYDTQDWQIQAGDVTATKVLQNFENIINGSATLDTGFIVLEHDLAEQCVDLSVDYVLPNALNFKPALTLQPIITCLGQDLAQAYIETHVASASDNSTAGSSGISTFKGANAGTAASSSATGGTKSAAGRVKIGAGLAVVMGLVGLVAVW